MLIKGCCLHVCVIDTRAVSTGSGIAHCVPVCTSSYRLSLTGSESIVPTVLACYLSSVLVI